MADRTKNKSVSLRPKKEGGRLMPSFGEADIITPTEGDVGDIIQSMVVTEGETLEKPYQYMEPADKPKTFLDKIMYRRLFFSNLFLSVVIILLWIIFGYLYDKFFGSDRTRKE